MNSKRPAPWLGFLFLALLGGDGSSGGNRCRAPTGPLLHQRVSDERAGTVRVLAWGRWGLHAGIAPTERSRWARPIILWL